MSAPLSGQPSQKIPSPGLDTTQAGNKGKQVQTSENAGKAAGVSQEVFEQIGAEPLTGKEAAVLMEKRWKELQKEASENKPGLTKLNQFIEELRNNRQERAFITLADIADTLFANIPIKEVSKVKDGTYKIVLPNEIKHKSLKFDKEITININIKKNKEGVEEGLEVDLNGISFKKFVWIPVPSFTISYGKDINKEDNWFTNDVKLSAGIFSANRTEAINKLREHMLKQS